jgi:hypothetical protein
MNFSDMYKIVRQRVERDIRLGARKCGRKTGDEKYDHYLRQTRIWGDALKTFSNADRKAWMAQVAATNEDLIALSKCESTAARSASWKTTCAGRVPNRQLKQASEKYKRLEAIRKIVDEFTAKSVRATAKVVTKELRESYKHLALVETDTIRKELSALKAARQSES